MIWNPERSLSAITARPQHPERLLKNPALVNTSFLTNRASREAAPVPTMHRENPVGQIRRLVRDCSSDFAQYCNTSGVAESVSSLDGRHFAPAGGSRPTLTSLNSTTSPASRFWIP